MKFFLKVLLILMVVLSTLNAQSSWTVSGPTGVIANTVFFVDSLNGYVGGWSETYGIIRKSTDGGATWTGQSLPVTDVINDILFLNASTGYAAGDNGTMLKTTNGGQTWTKKTSGTPERLQKIFFLNTQLGWACGGHTVVLTTDGGETWSSRFVQTTNTNVDIAFKDAKEGLVVSQDGGCFKSLDGGKTWTKLLLPVGSGAFWSVRYLSPTRVLLSGTSEFALSKDGGTTWTAVPSPYGTWVTGMSFADSLTGWAFAYHAIMKTTDGGSHWNLQGIPESELIKDLHTPDGIHAWAAGGRSLMKIDNLPAVSYSLSTIEAVPASIKADGKSTTKITVQIRDTDGNYFARSPGKVSLYTTLGTLGGVTDLNNGSYTADLRASSTPGIATITGALIQTPFTGSATVTMVAVGVSGTQSTIKATNAVIKADGGSTTTIVVKVKDNLGVDYTASAGALILKTTAGSIESVTDLRNGSYAAVLKSSVTPSVAIVTAQLDGVSLSASAVVLFAGSGSADPPLDTTTVSLAVGNTWYYTFVSYSANAIVSKEIIDTTATGDRTVAVKMYYPNRIVTSTETWSVKDGIFSIDGYPLYRFAFPNDTTLHFTFNGQVLKSQTLRTNNYTHDGHTLNWVFATAPGVGLWSRRTEAAMQYNWFDNDTLSLIGVRQNGKLYTSLGVEHANHDSLATYYPLQIGNIWQHSYWHGEGSSSSYDTMTTMIRRDTVINNKKYAFVETEKNKGLSYYARFDTATGCYYELASGAANEVLMDSTAAYLPGTYPWGTLGVGYLQGPFGMYTTVRKIEKAPDPYGTTTGYYTAWGIGEHNQYSSGFRYFSQGTILYARINGKEYGSMAGDTIWRLQSSGTTNILLGVSAIDAKTIVAVGRIGTIIRTTNGGETWVPQSSGVQEDLTGVRFTDANNGIVIGSGGTILRTTNGGATWTRLQSGTTEYLIDVSFANQKFGTVVGGTGTILHTSDGGATWVKQTSGTDHSMLGVAFADSNRGVIVGYEIILHTSDGGATWTKQSTGLASYSQLFAVCYVQGNTWCCVGDYGRVMWTTDGGVTWTTPPAVSQNFARFWGVQFPDPNHGFIVGDGGDLYRTTNGGKTWSKQIISTHHALLALSFLDGNTGTIVGESGTVLRYAGRDSLRSSTPDTVDTGGHDSTIVTPKVIDHFALEQNYPNPFNPTTTIVYDVPTAELVSLKIYDVLGREVAILVNEIKAPGRYAAVFNAAGYSSGMYIYRFSAGSFTQSKRMLYLK